MRQRWLRVLFRRRMLTILLLLLQVYFLICLVLGGSQLSRNFSRLLTIVSIIAVLYIVSQKDKGAYKTAWAILILTFPLFGGLMYLLSNAQSSKWRFAKSVLHTQQKAKPLYALPGICYESATKQLPEYYPQIHYLQEYTGFPIYADTETHYLTPGERKLETLLVLCQEKVQIKYALLMLSYPAKASALSSNAA
ncbi:PLD nuclease N-terminal domain-containing protein [Eubacterium sp. An3]|uniref:PLD nuclease N-terminal domain-containing protein n=1 Tax=Eubacterium sp. An3 TaxID=1965628 RepID=UPI001FA83EED|nr:PLD nuclease N-terminal domain-containing protein [Eubacterium sp. An3]